MTKFLNLWLITDDADTVRHDSYCLQTEQDCLSFALKHTNVIENSKFVVAVILIGL